MRLRHIEVINAIRVTGTLSAAAELLNLSQPAVTQILHSAERQLGYALFQRVRGRLVATREALQLYPEMEKLDAQLGAIRKLAENLRGERSDALRIIAAPALAETLVADAVAEMTLRYPNAHITVRAIYSDQAAADLALLDADIGILFHNAPHPAVREELLAMSRLMCIGPPSVVPPVNAIDLAFLGEHALVGPDPGDPIGRLLAQTCRDLGIDVKSSVQALSYHSVMALAARCQRVGIVEAATALGAEAMGLRAVPLLPDVRLPIIAATALQAEGNVLSRDFLDICRNVFAARLGPPPGVSTENPAMRA
ncbi:LysR family transcriptional regulator [Cupriavidus pauculus]|uniref:LysR family transcriptional regulator n=1 Tax=Cupriavidus pauculus TaxID=82633 RepID=UPI001EE28142|nr:LysR family transcriptional regulator [Cupriavidus pauculus]GJG97990.1 LysR family transcriptional regulator [Cupriavidus pauculus]